MRKKQKSKSAWGGKGVAGKVLLTATEPAAMMALVGRPARQFPYKFNPLLEDVRERSPSAPSGNTHPYEDVRQAI